MSRGSPVLTIGEVAKLMGVHITTVRRIADQGDLPHTRTPGGHRRFLLSDVSRFIPQSKISIAIYVQLGQEDEIHRIANILEESGRIPKVAIEERPVDLTRPLYARPGIIKMSEYAGEGFIQGYVAPNESLIGGYDQIQIVKILNNLGLQCFIASSSNIQPFPNR